MRRLFRPLVILFGFLMAFSATAQIDQSAPAAKPNVVIILVDDAALMDFGVYGGEARTPNIDALANNGALFTQFRASPLCSPSRAMLLTGVDNHQTGIATIPEILTKEQEGQPGYSMAFEPGVLTLADRLRATGYRTLLTGKWHLGETADEMPQAHGFDRSFALAASGADNWEDKAYMPYYKDAPWWEDGKEASLPADFYSSRFIVDKMIEYLGETDPAKPFFAYMPFQAIHIPVQAPAEFTANYRGRYDDGWQALRIERHARAQALGLIPQGAPLGDMAESARSWASLSDEDRARYAARMEVNAAMLEAMDFEIGRFVDALKAGGQFENTIFVVTSDNGPEFARGDNDTRLSLWMGLNGYHTDLEGIGERGSWGFIGPEWASAAASPSALYKFFATEGGVRVPLIVAGPGIAPSVIDAPAMMADIAPTLVEWVDASAAPVTAVPMTGRSLLPLLSGDADSVYGPNEARAIEVSGNSALYKGDFKITRVMPPMGDGRWRLFNLATDPGETNNIGGREPEILADLLAEYDAYAARVGVVEMPADYNSDVQLERNTLARTRHHYRGVLLLMFAFLAAAIYGLWRVGRALLRR